MGITDAIFLLNCKFSFSVAEKFFYSSSEDTAKEIKQLLRVFSRSYINFKVNLTTVDFLSIPYIT